MDCSNHRTGDRRAADDHHVHDPRRRRTGAGGPDEDCSGGFQRGGWLVPYADDDIGASVTAWFAEADAFLLGRRTYQIFAGHWPRVPDDNPIAAALNNVPKYVVSTTLQSLTWDKSTLIGPDVVDEMIYPVFLRAGRRLFDRPGLEGALRLADSKTTGSGVVVLTYEPAGAPQLGSFELAPEPEQHRILR
jgi:dihydrofolate reductase